MKKRLFILLGLLVSISIAAAVLTRKADAPTPPAPNNAEQKIKEPITVFDKNKYSLEDPNSLWVIVNKKRPIPLDYEPADLVTPSVQRDPKDSAKEQQIRKEAAKAVETMFAEAKAQIGRAHV